MQHIKENNKLLICKIKTEEQSGSSAHPTWTEGTSSKALMKSSSSTAPAPASLPSKQKYAEAKARDSAAGRASHLSGPKRHSAEVRAPPPPPPHLCSWLWWPSWVSSQSSRPSFYHWGVLWMRKRRRTGLHPQSLHPQSSYLQQQGQKTGQSISNCGFILSNTMTV